MGDVKIGSGDWVVVCDGSKAMILENEGDAKYPDLRVREIREHEDPKTGRLGTDRPGRVHESNSSRRSAVGQTDWHNLAEQDFLRMIAERLHEAVTQGKVRSLILVAPPSALGFLRQNLSQQVRDAVKAEIGKDYVNLPVYEIEKHLAASD